ncbi:MAG: LapA family protein [Spirochaetaceae bacterium]|nr:MAG: LapA family protein [Spirochaetaceae bacterium]
MRKVKLGVIVGLSLALVLVVMQNTGPIQGRFLWFSAEVPAILLLVLAVAGGFILGLLVANFYLRDRKPVPHREYTERTYRG